MQTTIPDLHADPDRKPPRNATVVREGSGPDLTDTTQPDTAASLTGAAAKWGQFYHAGDISKAQYDRAIELVLTRLETVTRAGVGGELVAIQCPHCIRDFKGPVSELTEPDHWTHCPLCGGSVIIKFDPASGTPVAIKKNRE